jgi:hypothetical protein
MSVSTPWTLFNLTKKRRMPRCDVSSSIYIKIVYTPILRTNVVDLNSLREQIRV